MKNKEYTLSFKEVLEEIFSTNEKVKYWYQGENFKDGHFLKIDEDGNINLYCFEEDFIGSKNFGTPILSRGLYTQKYRRVCTQPDVMRKC